MFFTALILKHDGLKNTMEKDAGIYFSLKKRDYLKLRLLDSIQLWLWVSAVEEALGIQVLVPYALQGKPLSPI